MAVTGIGTYASYTNSYGNTQNAGNKTGRTYKNCLLYTSDIWEILAYNRTQHKDIMSELNVQFVIADGTIQIN